MRSLTAAAGLLALAQGISAAQTPQPFPRPGEPSRPQPSAPQPPSRQPDTKGVKVLPPEPASTTPAPAAAAPAGEPSEQTLGLPIYPGAQFIATYDASRGQQYHLFGVNLDFAQIVAYYRTALKQRGDLVYDAPPIHMFEVGRFREETMAFPPGVTVKDYSPEGYLSLKQPETPQRFRTIIQIVPAPPAPAAR